MDGRVVKIVKVSNPAFWYKIGQTYPLIGSVPGMEGYYRVIVSGNKLHGRDGMVKVEDCIVLDNPIPPSIIMISGKSSTGKGTIAEELENRFIDMDYFVLRVSLSTYIREITKNDFFWDGKDTVESRKFMAEVYRLGTELIYVYHMARRIWEWEIADFLSFHPYDKKLVIVESFREPQNWEFFDILQKEDKIDKLLTVRVVRPGADDATTDEELKEHVSEKFLS